MQNIERCRTAELGGHKDTCDACGHVRISYNSCRDRHCPKCQSLKKDEWLSERCERLLPIPYFHVVFTLPHGLNALALGNRKLLYRMLFDVAADTLQTIARDKQHLGAEVGFTAILHTWGQNLQFHPHLHCVVTGGGLSSDARRWIPSRDNFFLPVKVLARLFRGRFLAALRRANKDGKIRFSGSTTQLSVPAGWHRFLDDLYSRDWVVYAKPPFGGPEHVFSYLGRYTHRVAISNHRLISAEGGKVHFRMKDYANGGKNKTIALDSVEFIRRFLLHVLPKNFVRIRHYGLLAARNVNTKLVRARELLLENKVQLQSFKIPPRDTPIPWWQRLFILTGVDLFKCPACRVGRLVRTELPTHSPWIPSTTIPEPCFET